MSNVSEIKVGDRVRSLVTEAGSSGNAGVYAGNVYVVRRLTHHFHAHPTRPSLYVSAGTDGGHYLHGDEYEPVEEPSASAFESLTVTALPKGGFKVSNPNDLNIETVDLAAFSTLSEAVVFLNRQMRA